MKPRSRTVTLADGRTVTATGVDGFAPMVYALMDEIEHLQAARAETLQLLRAADCLFACQCSDATAWNWLDDVRGVLAAGVTRT